MNSAAITIAKSMRSAILSQISGNVFYDYNLLISLVKQCEATLNGRDLVKHSWNLSNL
jgi:hypothetical protein